MDEGLQPETVDEQTEPYEFVDDLFDSESEFLVDVYIGEGVVVDVDDGEEEVFEVGVGDEDGYDFDCGDCYQESDEEILMFQEFKDVGFAAGDVDLMCVDEAEAAHDVKDIETTVEGVVEGAVGVLEGSPISGEVVVGEGEGIDDELH